MIRFTICFPNKHTSAICFQRNDTFDDLFSKKRCTCDLYSEKRCNKFAQPISRLVFYSPIHMTSGILPTRPYAAWLRVIPVHFCSYQRNARVAMLSSICRLKNDPPGSNLGSPSRWVLLAPPGSPWVLLAPPGSPWVPLAPPGSHQAPKGSVIRKRIPSGFLGTPRSTWNASTPPWSP